MPANRSRTERWKECLADIAQRGGGIELSIDRGQSITDESRPDLVWRVRLAALTATELVAEHPTSLHKPVELPAGTAMIGAMTIGQNRWMFRTTVLGPAPGLSRGSPMLRLAAPDHVERCSRRSFYRVPLGSVELPQVEIWPLLDPMSAVAAEVANRAACHDLEISGPAMPGLVGNPVLPDVGPRFVGHLANLGGGGAGLLVDRDDSGSLDCSKHLWLRIDLRPELAAPIGLVAKVAHSHADSSGRVYAGVAFEFGFSQGHQEFVAEQIARYVNAVTAAGREARRKAA